MAGALKTLFGALQASAFMSGVSLAFGEEEVDDQSKPLPLVVMVPVGGPIEDNGYSGGGDPTVERRYKISERVSFWCWSRDAVTPNAQPIDHADATESLRDLVLAAMQDQRAQYTDVASVANGLAFKVSDQRWDTAQNTLNRYGRGIVIAIDVEITSATPTPPFATIATEQLNFNIQQGPS